MSQSDQLPGTGSEGQQEETSSKKITLQGEGECLSCLVTALLRPKCGQSLLLELEKHARDNLQS